MIIIFWRQCDCVRQSCGLWRGESNVRRKVRVGGDEVGVGGDEVGVGGDECAS